MVPNMCVDAEGVQATYTTDDKQVGRGVMEYDENTCSGEYLKMSEGHCGIISASRHGRSCS